MTFTRYAVRNGEYKANVHYSHGLSVKTGSNMVVLYEKGYNKDWAQVFDEWEDDTDFNTDYFDTRKVRFYEGTPEYNQVVNLMKGWGILQS